MKNHDKNLSGSTQKKVSTRDRVLLVYILVWWVTKVTADPELNLQLTNKNMQGFLKCLSEFFLLIITLRHSATKLQK